MGCDVQVNSRKESNSDANVCLFGAFGPCLTVACRIILLRGLCLQQDTARRLHQNGGNNRTLVNTASEEPNARVAYSNPNPNNYRPAATRN